MNKKVSIVLLSVLFGAHALNASQPNTGSSDAASASTSTAQTPAASSSTPGSQTAASPSVWEQYKPSYETTAGSSIALGTVAATGGALYGVHKLWQHRAKVAQWVKEHPYKATLFGLLGTLGIGGSAYAWYKWMPSSVNGFFSTGANTAWGKVTGFFSHPAMKFIGEKAATPVIAGLSLGLTNYVVRKVLDDDTSIPGSLSGANGSKEEKQPEVKPAQQVAHSGSEVQAETATNLTPAEAKELLRAERQLKHATAKTRPQLEAKIARLKAKASVSA
jgi:hypothetical protein